MNRPTHADGRQARLAEIRRRIVEGTYETPDKLEAAVDAFLDRHVAPGQQSKTSGIEQR